MIKQPYGVSRFRKAFVHFIGGRVAQATARAVLLLVLVRLLPVADYGAYMLLVGISEMMPQLASFGIPPVAQRYLPQMITSLPAWKLHRFVSTLILLQVGILLVVNAVLWQVWSVVTPLMGFTEVQIASTQNALWLFLLVPVFRFAADMLEALLEQGRAQIARALMPTGRVAGIGLLLVLDYEIDLPGIILVDVVVTIACLLLAWVLLRQSLDALHVSEANGDIPVREMVRFGWHMAAVGLMGSTASPGAIRLALANTLGVVESGLYAFLQSLQRLVGRYLPGTLLRGIIRPVLVARAFTPGGMVVVEAGTGLLFKSNLLIVAAGSVIVAVGGDALVSWLSGGKFMHAGFTLFLMFLALAVTAQRAVIDMVMQITGHTSTLRATSMIAPPALLAVWLYADLGLNFAVLIIAGATALSNGIAMAVLVRSAGGFKVDWRGLAAIVVVAMLVIGVGMLMATMVNPVLAIIIALALYLVFLWLAKPFNSQELSVVERAAGRRIAALMRGFSRQQAGEPDQI